MANPHYTNMGTLIELWRVLEAANVSAQDIKTLSTMKPQNIAAAITIARTLHTSGLTNQEVVKLSRLPDDVKEMLAFMRTRPNLRLIHGRFAPLADKVAMVKSWPDVNPADVDAAVALAREDGTIAGFEAESPNNPFLDLVITVYRENIPATLLYGCARMKEAWGDCYAEWKKAYASGVDDKRVELIPDSSFFQPNTIVVQAVDFGANWDPNHGNVLSDVQRAQAGELADFAGLFNASQSPKWVEQMDGKTVPHTILAALLLSVPGYGERSDSPYIYHDGDKTGINGYRVRDRFRWSSMAVVRGYKS